MSDDQVRRGVHDLAEALHRIITHGCSNHGCQIRKPEGMGTNSSCKCYKTVFDYALEIATRIEPLKNRHGLKPLPSPPQAEQRAP